MDYSNRTNSPSLLGYVHYHQSVESDVSYTLVMKTYRKKPIKAALDLNKVIEEGHMVHAAMSAKILVFEKYHPEPNEFSNFEDFYAAADEHVEQVYNARNEANEMLIKVYSELVKHPELTGSTYVAILELIGYLAEDFRQLTLRYEAASSALNAAEDNQYGDGDTDIYVGERGARTMLNALNRLKKFGQLTHDEEGLETELQESVANQNSDINWKQPRLN